MSALAQFYAEGGHRVTGSDREESPTTQLLEQKGIRVVLQQQANNVPEDAQLVVYSDAVWEDNPERMKAAERNIPQVSYFEALGSVSKDMKTLAVSGTHGKTTTTAMLADILKDCGKKPTAIVGSIVREFGSNYLSGDKNLLVVEACEYKDHVLKLRPTILVITNLEWDHTDWFPSLEAMQNTFRKAEELVPESGAIIANPHDPNVAPVLAGSRARVIDYTTEQVPELQLIGEFNRMNARAAKAAALAFSPELDETSINASLSSFIGTWRRFETKGKTRSGALVIDDYAHHPTAIRETVRAARVRYPEKKITVVFHPHLYSRTRDLFGGFVEELAKADRIIMVPIYPAREEPIQGITSDAVAEEIRKVNSSVESMKTFSEIEEALRNSTGEGDVIITMGAGDVYKVADALVV